MAGGREYDQTRLENLVLYLAARSATDEGYGKVKLNKLLFRADFEAYRLLGASITGEEYKRQDLGPVAAHVPSLLTRLERQGVLRIDEIPAGPYTRQVPVVIEGHEADMTLFTDDERAIIDRAIGELREYGARSVSEWSHEQSSGWRVRKNGRLIPYASAFVSTKPLSPEQMERAVKRSREEDWASIRP